MACGGFQSVSAIDQDSLGHQCYRASRNGICEIWKKPLAGGHLGVGLFNRDDKTRSVCANWSDLEISGTYPVRDLWARADRGTFASAFSSEVDPHGCILLRLIPG